MKFLIEITETRSRIITIDAATPDAVPDIAIKKYQADGPIDAAEIDDIGIKIINRSK